MCYYTDNPVADYEAYSAEQEKELNKLPKCSECGNHIMTDDCWVINDEIYCPECAEKNFRKWTEDYLDQ